ncbi:MAG: hypothetical protein E7214_17020 [Clostridium sp.]|nr:hypothetical protein [Clostridium sp.]
MDKKEVEPMKILAPLCSINEVEGIIKAGADEIYCGVIDNEINSKYNIPIINRRPYKTSNIDSFKELGEVITRSHDLGVPVYVTLNEAVYTEKQYDFIEENIEKLCELKADAVIVADVGVLQFIKDKNYDIKVHISTCCSTYNSEAVNFYKYMGACRIVLPRHMSIDEINRLKKSNPDMEYEILMLNTNCQYDDGYCTYEHCLGNYSREIGYKGGGCGAIQNMKMYCKKDAFKDGNAPDIIGQYKKRQRSLPNTCGACGIKSIDLTDIDSFKIVGRSYVLKKKVKDVTFLYHVRNLIKENIGQATLKNEIKNIYKEIYNRDCEEKCFY